jgi:hypothetical protein
MGRAPGNRQSKETIMTTQKFSLKVVACTMAALALTMAMSWSFVDATKVARVQRDAAHGVVDSVAALVR